MNPITITSNAQYDLQAYIQGRYLRIELRVGCGPNNGYMQNYQTTSVEVNLVDLYRGMMTEVIINDPLTNK